MPKHVTAKRPKTKTEVAGQTSKEHKFSTPKANTHLTHIQNDKVIFNPNSHVSLILKLGGGEVDGEIRGGVGGIFDDKLEYANKVILSVLMLVVLA